MQPIMPADQQKALGAYYTDESVARFLAEWAIRDRSAMVLEPSFGGGVFLSAAANRLSCLGGHTFNQLYGCELDRQTYEAFWNSHGTELGLDRSKLVVGDFFDMRPDGANFDVVLGNPPFVRYQSFAGSVRQRALQRAAEAGVRLSELSSSWAPFVVHASRFLKIGGRLAMVAPLELLHASYAGPVLRYLRSAFRETRLLTFGKRLFPALNQDTLLILADGYQQPAETVSVTHLASVDDLPADTDLERLSSIDITQPLSSVEGFRAALYRLPPDARFLYQQLARDERLLRLGHVASIGIGYVTGANEFFHLSTHDIAHWQLDRADVLPAVRRGRDLRVAGLAITRADWLQLERSNEPCWLFHPKTAFSQGVAAYIAHGEHVGVHERYKCRTRRPWWRVPWVVQPDLVLTVMAGSGPRLVANEAGAVVTNSLHTVVLSKPVHPRVLAAASLSTLGQLSAEIEGHALGGGMLKLEPSEAERLLLPCNPELSLPDQDLLELDRLVRTGNSPEAQTAADRLFLTQYLGLHDREVSILREALSTLRSWRQHR